MIGECLRYENKIEEAERRFREGLKASPESIPLLGDLAQVLGDQMRYAEAFACIEKALAREPHEPLILATKGILQDLTGQEAQAESLLRAALQAAPENVDIGHSLAILRLRHGHFEEGWQGLELRRRKEYFVGRYRKFPFAEWQGEPLTGKTILVYPEQGLGDEIMYGSCIRELVARARHVAIECDHKLGALFARSFPLCTVTARLRTMANDWVNHLEPRPDYQVPMASPPRGGVSPAWRLPGAGRRKSGGVETPPGHPRPRPQARAFMAGRRRPYGQGAALADAGAAAAAAAP